MYKHIAKIINNETVRFYTLETGEVVIGTKDLSKIIGSKNNSTMRSIRTLYDNCELDGIEEGLTMIPWNYIDSNGETRPNILINFELYTLHICQLSGIKYRNLIKELTDTFIEISI